MRLGSLDTTPRPGGRGFPGASSLADELEIACHKQSQPTQPGITVEQILEAAVQFHVRTGEWPTQNTKEPIPDGALKGTTWRAIDVALRAGRRGLPGGSSLPFVLKPFKEAAKEGRLEEFVRERLGEQSGKSDGAKGSSPISNPPPKFDI